MVGSISPEYDRRSHALNYPATEIENLRKEALAFRHLRAAMLAPDDSTSAAMTVFNKVP